MQTAGAEMLLAIASRPICAYCAGVQRGVQSESFLVLPQRPQESGSGKPRKYGRSEYLRRFELGTFGHSHEARKFMGCKGSRIRISPSRPISKPRKNKPLSAPLALPLQARNYLFSVSGYRSGCSQLSAKSGPEQDILNVSLFLQRADLTCGRIAVFGALVELKLSSTSVFTINQIASSSSRWRASARSNCLMYGRYLSRWAGNGASMSLV